MGLNKSKGQMYGFVTHTWNVFKGKCGYDCSYCYMKRFPQKPIRFDASELKTDLGSGNKIFVGSSTDMFHPDNSNEQIQEVLDYCKKFHNEYLFQTKNPARFNEFRFPEKSIFCVTLENDTANVDGVYLGISKASPPFFRMCDILNRISFFKKLMITIEPIMKFTKGFSTLLRSLKPFQINIGADSGNNNLPEPSKDEVLQLISECEKFTKVVQKDNLKRLLK